MLEGQVLKACVNLLAIALKVTLILRLLGLWHEYSLAGVGVRIRLNIFHLLLLLLLRVYVQLATHVAVEAPQ